MPDGQVRVDISATSTVPATVQRDIAALRSEEAAFNNLAAGANAGISGLEARMEQHATRMEALAARIQRAGVQARVSWMEGYGPGGGGPSVPPPPAPPQIPYPSERVYVNTAVSAGAMAGATRQIEQQIAAERLLGETASDVESVRAAQLQTRMGLMAAENAAMRRNYQEEERANVERMKFSQQMAPQMSLAEEERANQERLRTAEMFAPAVMIASHRKAVDSMIADLARYGKEQDTIAKGSLEFASKIAPALGLASNITFSGSRAAGDLKAIADEGKKAEQSLGNFGLFGKHIVALFDEDMRNARGAMVSTIGAMLRDSGLLGTAITLLGAGGLAASAGILALAGTVVYATYQLIANRRASEELAGSFALMGQATSTSVADIDAWRNDLRATFDLSQGQSRAAAQAILTIPRASQETKTALAGLAATISASTGANFNKTVEEVSKAARSGAMGVDRLADSLGINLDPHIVETARKLEELGERTEALRMITAAAATAPVDTTEVWTKQTAAANAYARAIGSIYSPHMRAYVPQMEGAGAFIAPEAPTPGPTPPATVARPYEETTAATEAEAAGLKLVKIDAERAAYQTFIDGQLKHQAELQKQIADVQTQPRDRADSDQGERLANLRRLQEESVRAVAEAGDKQDHLHYESETREYQATLDRIGANEALYQKDAEKQLQYEKEKYEAAVAYASLPIRREQTGATEAEIRQRAERDPNVQRRGENVATAEKNAARQRIEIEIETQREIIAEDRRGGQERVRANLEILRLMRANEKEFGPVEILRQQAAVRVAERQAADQAFQTEREETQIAVADAKEHAGAIEKIAEAYDHLRQVARETGQLPRVQLQIDRDQASADKATKDAAFSRLMEQNSAEEKLAQSRVAAFTASERAMVDAHRMSKADMATAIESFQATEMASQEARLEEELKINVLSETERQKLNDRLAELYAKDAAQHEQAQERITRTIEEENDKRIKAFTSFFDTAGSALEKFLTEGITRSTTRAQALQQLGRSLVGSVVSSVGHFASEAAGSFIGPKLGLTEEQSKGGLGEVFGTAITKALGLYKSTPQENQAKAAELFQKSAETQAKATGSNTDAIRDLIKAIQAETESRKRASDDVQRIKRTDRATDEGGRSAAGEYGVNQTGARTGQVAVSRGQAPMANDMFGWLKEHGYSDTAAAGIVGNSIQESSLNPRAAGAAGELGLFQELGPRRRGLEQYAAGQGTSPTDWKTQMEFMDQELQKLDPTFKKAGDSASALAARFEEKFEQAGAGRADVPARQRYAEAVLKEQSVPPSVADQSNAIDKTAALGVGNRYGNLDNVQAFIIHHTGGGQNVEDVISTFKQRDVASQFVIDRQGQTFRTLPEGAQGRHIIRGSGAGEGLSNANTEGVEVIAKDDSDVNKAQIEAAKRLVAAEAQRYHFDPATQVFGHGEVNPGHKEASEGLTIADQIRSQQRAIAGSKISGQSDLASYNTEQSSFAQTADAVAQGVAKGQQQAAPTIQTAVQAGSSQGARDAAPAVTDATKAGIEAGDDDLTADMKQSAQAVADNKAALDKNTQALSQQKPAGGQTSPTVSGGSAVGGDAAKTGQMSVNLGLLTQGLGIAATAASVFGRQLSTQARTVLGAVGLLSQVAGFAKSAGSALDLFGTATKGTQTATALMQTANIGNTTATTANTLATTANSAAETTASAASGASSGIGAAFKAIPILGALFEQGGIVPAAVGGMMVGTSVPSAAGGMVVPGSALGGGGQLSILHPREMVLPAHLSAAVQRMANSSLSSANTSVGDARNSFQTLPPPPQVTHNSPQSSFTYAPQITGRFASPSASEMRGILRTHGDLFDNYARNYMRNNHL